MSVESHDAELRELLDSIGMRPGDRAVSPEQEVLDGARAERDLAAIIALPVGRQRAAALRTAGTRRGWRLRLVAGLVAACVVGVVGYVLLPSASPPAAAQTPPLLSFSGSEVAAAGGIEGRSASADLGRLADRAGAQPASAALPVQRIEQYAWWATSDTSDTAPPTTVLIPIQRTTYLTPRGKLRDVEAEGEPLDQYGRISAADGSWRTTPATSDDTNDTGMPADYPETLPADPARLLEELAPADGCSDTPGDCVLNALANIYTTYVVSPRAAEALWQAARLEPDIESLGTTKDRLGRAAVALTATAPPNGVQTIVLADPRTGRFLGSETILTKPNDDFAFTPPAVVGFTAVLSAERVASAR